MQDQIKVSNDEIDILGVIKSLYKKRVFILKVMLSCSFIGLFISLVSNRTYMTELTFTLSDNKDKSRSSQVSSLASLAGIDINPTDNSVLSPIAYPIIFCRR